MKIPYTMTMALCASFLVSSCANMPNNMVNIDVQKLIQSAQSVKEATVDMTEEQEINVGQGIANNLLGLAPLLPDRKIQLYVNQVGRWVSLQTERPDLPWTFAVIDSPEINAFATPGGYIVITKGFLMRMRSEAELAGVLAHEIAHVLSKHHLKAIKKAAGMNVAQTLVGMGLDAKGANPALAKLSLAGTELYTRGLDKEDELEADRMGVVLAARSGYDPYGLPAALQTLQAINSQTSGLSLMLKTHPTLSHRLEALNQVMGSSLEPFENQAHLANRFNSIINTKRN